MNLVLKIPSAALPIKLPTLSSHFPQKIPKPATTFRGSVSIPARDRVIDFGKYKGKMMGSLPSTYLKWVSRNLRAGDTEEWAKLADQVLVDPVYRDRMEWEIAENILSGDVARASSWSGGNDNKNAVNELVEISERFGWDNEDKCGWSKIDFGLLGTSKGGRIPRVAAAEAERRGEVGRLGKDEKKEVEEGDGRGRRRERMRRRLREKTSIVKSGHGEADAEGGFVGRRSPFPGREALLNKVLNRQQL